MRISITDDAALALEPYVTLRRSLDDLASVAILRVGHLHPQARHLILDESAMNTLETRLGLPALGSQAQLVVAVDQLADLKLGNISFQFTPSQWRELKDRANREGVEPAEFAKRIIQAMIPMFFTVAPAEPPVLVGSGKQK